MSCWGRTRAVAMAAIVAMSWAVAAPGVWAGPTEPSPDRWEAAPPMLLGRALHEMAVLPDGRVLVPGGLHLHYAGGSAPTAEIFDPSTGSWTLTAPMATPHSKHTVTALLDGRVLVAGGEGRVAVQIRGNALTQSEVYDPHTNRWSTTGPMVSEVPFNHSATLLGDGRVLVAGGSWSGTTASGVLAVAQLYDPTTNQWQATAPMHRPRSYHASALLDDGRVLVAGGRGPDGRSMTAAEVWDPTTGHWAEVAPLPVPHHNETNAAVGLPDGRVLIAGGSNSEVPLAEAFATTTQVFDPETGVWEVAAPLSVGRNDHSVVALADGRVLVAGGQVWFAVELAMSAATTATEIYDPAAGTWTAGPPMAVARTNAAAVALPSGDVLVTGGLHQPPDGAYLVDPRVERFRPAT